VSSPSDDATTVVPPVPQSQSNGAFPAEPRPPSVDQGRRLPRPGQAVRLSLLALAIVVSGAVAGFVASLQFPVQYAARAELVYLIGQEAPTTSITGHSQPASRGDGNDTRRGVTTACSP